jgi:RND family efflux transporter MFP subunit
MRFRIAVITGGAVLAVWAGARARPAPIASGRPPVAVEAVPATTADVVEHLEVVGSLAPKLNARIKSEYSGIVAAVHVTEWVAVRKGRPLATLDAHEPQAAADSARAALLQAEVAERRAARERDRAERLREFGLLTQQGLDDAQTAAAAAAAATSAARAHLDAATARLAKTVIRAPFDGLIAFRGVNVGDRVESMGSSDPMFEVVDDRVLELTMTVPSTRLGDIRVGQAIEFTVDSVPDRTFIGRMTHVNPSVDRWSRAAHVVADVPNHDGLLKGGLFVKARIETRARPHVLQIPRTALLGWDITTGRADVFVIDNGVARRRSIRTGAVTDDRAEVAEGLAPGERVATRGAFNLRPDDRVTIAPDDGA